MNYKEKIHNVIFETWIDCFIYNNKYILNLRRNHRKISMPILFLTSPLILLNWIICAVYAKTIGLFIVWLKIKKDNKREYKFQTSIVAISKNEGLYLKEWIEYHRLIGIDKIYFYDNESEDNTCEIIQPYVDKGFVDYTLIKGVGKQLEAYNDAISKHKFDSRFMAFIDLDEYIMPEKKCEPISSIITEILSHRVNAAGIAVNWCLYGNSYHVNRPQGLITENYVNRAKQLNYMNRHIKTICNPRLIREYISPHYPQYVLGAISIDTSGRKRSKAWFCKNITFANLRLNHYWCKSEEDYKIKMSRGLGDRKGEYDMSKFHRMNFNDVYDDSMLVYKNDLEKALSHEN